jgi:DNA (cytosine-5)-methyltransferase 1
MAWGGAFLTVASSESPSHVNDCSLLDIIETQTPPPKYFLSANAAKGIIARVKKRGRRMFPPLWKALETLAAGQSSPDSRIVSQPAQEGTLATTGAARTSSTRRRAGYVE